ncbi:MAG: hypothetical protein ACI8YQ_004844 [Polaribacter sp.]
MKILLLLLRFLNSLKETSSHLNAIAAFIKELLNFLVLCFAGFMAFDLMFGGWRIACALFKFFIFDSVWYGVGLLLGKGRAHPNHRRRVSEPASILVPHIAQLP